MRETPTNVVAQIEEQDRFNFDQEHNDFDPIWEGGNGFGSNDCRDLSLKFDHAMRPLWICSDGRVFLNLFLLSTKPHMTS